MVELALEGDCLFEHDPRACLIPIIVKFFEGGYVLAI
jgi:hypothetical protein